MEQWHPATLLALILHQIDAAFWHEWNMFRVLGGAQRLLAFNLLAVGVLLHGYRQVMLFKPSARAHERLCGAVGAGTALVHVAFAAAGHDEFHLPVFIAALAALVAGLGPLHQSRRASTAHTQVDGMD
ncbi:DUF6713 family protein [Stenotrophomonas indicatrix]